MTEEGAETKGDGVMAPHASAGECANPRRVLEGRKLPTSRDMLEFLESEA